MFRFSIECIYKKKQSLIFYALYFKFSLFYFNSNMKKPSIKNKDLQQDEKAQSRMQLKSKLKFVSEDFSISRLTDSHNDHMRDHNMFPQINQPTLQFKTENENFQKYVDDLSLDNYEAEGLTARLNSYQDRSANQLFILQERIESLMKEVDEKNVEIQNNKKKTLMMHKQIDKMKKQMEKKDQIIIKQQKQISNLKLKNSISDYETKSNYSGKSLMQESIQNFCPQLLSPDETVELLNQLLKKVSKSSKMMRSLTNDQVTKQILTKIHKN